MKHMVFDTDWLDEDEFSLEDERANLGCERTGTIFVAADLGLWNGRRPGFRFIEGNGSLDRVFDAFCGDCFSLYVEDGELKGEDVHHDGRNLYTFWEVVDRDAADEISDLVYSGGEIPDGLLRQGLRPLGPAVSGIFGWEGGK